MNYGLAQIRVTRHCCYPLICADPPFICGICVKAVSRNDMVTSCREASRNSGHDLSKLRRSECNEAIRCSSKPSQLQTNSTEACTLLIDPRARSSARHSRLHYRPTATFPGIPGRTLFLTRRPFFGTNAQDVPIASRASVSQKQKVCPGSSLETPEAESSHSRQFVRFAPFAFKRVDASR